MMGSTVLIICNMMAFPMFSEVKENVVLSVINQADRFTHLCCLVALVNLHGQIFRIYKIIDF